MIDEVNLVTEGHNIVVRVRRNGEWHELIRTHGALSENSVDYYAKVSCLFAASAPQPTDKLTNKHREQILDSLRELADWLDPDRMPRRPTHQDQETPLELVAILGARNPRTDEVSLLVRVRDPRKVLRKGYGCVEGFVMMGAGDYSYDRVEVAEHLSTLFAQDAIDHSKAGDS